MSEQREKILARVLKLRARADADSSSEAEMNKSLDIIASLLSEYKITEAELAQAANEKVKLKIVKGGTVSPYKGSKQKHHVLFAVSAIAKYTDTKAIIDGNNRVIVFVGHEPDVAVADYLTAIVRNALDREYVNYYKTLRYGAGSGVKTSFQISMAETISRRLLAMKEAENASLHSVASTATALVVQNTDKEKANQISEKMKDFFPNIVSSKPRNIMLKSSSAYNSGKAAGEKVNLGRALEEKGTRAKMIAA